MFVCVAQCLTWRVFHPFPLRLCMHPALGMTQGYALYVGTTKVCHTPPTAPVAFGE